MYSIKGNTRIDNFIFIFGIYDIYIKKLNPLLCNITKHLAHARFHI